MADAIRIRLLGEFEASSGDLSVAPSAWRLRKARTVIKLLAVEPSHTLHRDQVVDALWPGLDPDAARNNLHQVVHAARKALSTLGVDGSAALVLRNDLLVLGDEVAVVTDLEELQAAVDRARATGRPDGIARALTAHSGELLPQDAYEPWAQDHASSYREWRLQQVMDVAEAQLAAGEADTVAVLLSPLTKGESLHEPAQRLLMRALADSGRRSEALVVYERLRTLLRDELGADPERETRQVFRDLLTEGNAPAGSREIPAPRGSGNLPAAVTPLIGRTRELAETAATLGRTRLLTLTGMGGVGKTTLALELARRCTREFPGGVHLVELGGVHDSGAVVSQLARVLQIELPADAAPIDAMIAQLGQRKVLVVLDNCEHLIEACARVVSALLRGCPGLTVLATSREPLRIEGEVSWRTPSLQLPDPDAPATHEELADVASVELFVQRASAVLPGFTLDEDNAAAVAEICYRLDGIPLALELAAACIPSLSPQQISDRLGDALNLLRRGGRATITRQQTLAATLAWSHDLLDDDERLLFRRLAAFAGPFTLEAIEAVCGSGLDSATVLAAIARLVDTSLVVAEVRGGVARYRLLETVRQYAAQQLTAAGEHAELQERHCDFYLTLVQARDPERSATTATLAASTLDVDHDNLRAALRCALQHRPDVALQLIASLWRYWLARGYFAEGRAWIETALDVAPEPTWLRARALVALAFFDVRRGSGERLSSLGAESLAIARSLGSPPELAQALLAHSVIAFMRGEWDESWNDSVDAHEVATAADASHVAIAARYMQAVVLMSRSRYDDARCVLTEVRTAIHGLAAETPPFLPPILLGFAVDDARTASPRIYFEETVLLGRLVGADQADAYLLCNLADIARQDGELDAAVDLLDKARSRFAAIGDHDGEALTSSRAGCLHRVRGEFAAGREALTHSLRIRRSTGDRRSIGLNLGNLGVLTAAEGDVPTGVELVEEALNHSCEIHDGAADVGLTLTLASIHAAAGDRETAGRLLVDVLPRSMDIPGNHRVTAWAQVMLADVLATLGRPDESAQAAQAAHELFAALGAAPEVQSRR